MLQSAASVRRQTQFSDTETSSAALQSAASVRRQTIVRQLGQYCSLVTIRCLRAEADVNENQDQRNDGVTIRCLRAEADLPLA